MRKEPVPGLFLLPGLALWRGQNYQQAAVPEVFAFMEIAIQFFLLGFGRIEPVSPCPYRLHVNQMS